MARPIRIEFAGALYHVTARGNARAAIYLDDADGAAFPGVLFLNLPIDMAVRRGSA